MHWEIKHAVLNLQKKVCIYNLCAFGCVLLCMHVYVYYKAYGNSVGVCLLFTLIRYYCESLYSVAE